MDSMNQLSGHQSLIYKAVKDSFTFRSCDRLARRTCFDLIPILPVCLPIEQSVSEQRQRESPRDVKLQQVHVLPPQQQTLADSQPLQIPQRLRGQRVTSPAAQHGHTHSTWRLSLGQKHTKHAVC